MTEEGKSENTLLLERSHIEEYCIPLDHFKNPPMSNGQPMWPEKYVGGERITREDFNSLLIESFAVSRGVEAGQWAFLEWLRLNSGFDFEGTLSNFRSAGGWNCLLPHERQDFINAYKGIQIHRKFDSPEVLEDEITRNLKNALGDFLPEFPN